MDHSSHEPSLLSFKKDCIIRLVKNKHLHLANGKLLTEFNLFFFTKPETLKQLSVDRRRTHSVDDAPIAILCFESNDV